MKVKLTILILLAVLFKTTMPTATDLPTVRAFFHGCTAFCYRYADFKRIASKPLCSLKPDNLEKSLISTAVLGAISFAISYSTNTSPLVKILQTNNDILIAASFASSYILLYRYINKLEKNSNLEKAQKYFNSLEKKLPEYYTRLNAFLTNTPPDKTRYRILKAAKKMLDDAKNGALTSNDFSVSPHSNIYLKALLTQTQLGDTWGLTPDDKIYLLATYFL